MLLWFGLVLLVPAAEHKGTVRSNGLPLPGATVIATQSNGNRAATITDAQGAYTFADLAGGGWMIEVSMQLFETVRREATEAPMEFDLPMLPADKVAALVPATQPQQQVLQAKPAPRNTAAAPDNAELARQAADGFLINGSVNNGAASPFAQLPAFGNFRKGQRSMYNGNLGLIANSSAFDARAYSLTGQQMPKPAYNRVQGLFAFGGPLRIPRLLEKNGPMFVVNYQWMRNRTASTGTGLMPTAAERSGTMSGTVVDPANGLPFPRNQIPSSRISPQASNLLELYPLPNFDAAGARYNFQAPIVNALHQDDLQTRVNKRVRRNSFGGAFALQSTRTDSPDLFGFLNVGSVLGWNASTQYSRTINNRTLLNTRFELSRLRNRVTPWFSNRRNVSGEAGIIGNNQEAINWGPPAVQFADGITVLSQPQASLNRNQTASLSADMFLSRGRHNVTYGYTHRRQQFNVVGQQDARGSMVFSSLGSFLLGLPDTSSIAFGNADKYLRGTTHEAFVSDDWRVNPGLTINAGVRWEYWSPLREKYGRLVNLQPTAGFAGAGPVVGQGASPQPDRNNLAPRVAFSWRPLAANSTVIRGGYGIYFDTSVYQPIAMQMAQQAPLSTSLRLSNTTATPLTLANPFGAMSVPVTQATTFGVDPLFRVGYVHSWQLSVQTDLPWALQMTATYLGSKGANGQQTILPNTSPNVPAPNAGYSWLISEGESVRHAGQLQLRRRLRSGLAGNLQYTWAKSIDNAAPGGRNQGGTLLAQNWRDLAAERALSNFDQRHVVSAGLQYTTGMGMRGGALRTGRMAAFLKDWTIGSQFDIATGTPQTAIVLRPIAGTGVTGSLRADYTGAPVDRAPVGFFVNPAAFAPPAEDRWGNAGRNTITGPSQLVMNASLGRTLRSNERVSFDVRVDAMNALNSVNYSRWNTIVGNAQFGLPTGANAMRTVQLTGRVRF
ncbi:MAG: TonB-dependent receptor [Bryobacterales bacterium]|nr:TonB-dependent receptor [Bryobacterales bacterium]